MVVQLEEVERANAMGLPGRVRASKTAWMPSLPWPATTSPHGRRDGLGKFAQLSKHSHARASTRGGGPHPRDTISQTPPRAAQMPRLWPAHRARCA